jgi:RNA polymerase sigma-70 factor (ECF subfamily)
MSVSSNTNTETLLILQLKEGSSRAFDSIYRMYAKRLYAYCLQFTKSPEDSEEIVQDVFVKLWTNREQIKQEDTLRSLLFIMTKHHVINAFRSRINQPAYEEYVSYRETEAVDDVGQQMEYQDFVARFKKAMQTLPATQKKVIFLSRIKGLSNKEIAEKLALSEQTVKNSLSVGLKDLKAAIGKLHFPYILIFINAMGVFGTV